ncbi:MAG: hypothetical protein R2932_32945 [Caldilineaceae bacterium]
MSTLQHIASQGSLPYQQRQATWWGHLLWVWGAAVLGWACTALFAGLMHWSRPFFLIPYVLLTGGFMLVWLRWSDLNWRSHLIQHWGWGLLGTLVVGVFVVQNVLRQPHTPMPQGINLAIDLLWLGLLYGLVDGLFLTVLPVAATWQAFTLLGWTARWSGRIGAGVMALLASLLVTATYHWGYPEFQGAALFGPLVGVGMMSVAYLLSRSPLAPILSHIAMHVAAVLFGLSTAIQLPPHY